LNRWRQSFASEWPRFGLDTVATGLLMLVFVAAVMQMAANTYNPFIYFRF
jgi:hypothetical protein